MPHGDFSDYASFFCLGSGLASIFAPQLYFTELGPVKPFFAGPATPETTMMIEFAGGLFIFMGLVLFVNRWNVINGKAGGLGCFVIAGNSASIAYAMDGTFVPRGWHIVSAMMTLAGLHLCFNANPMWTSETLKAKEDAKAAKKAAKTK